MDKNLVDDEFLKEIQADFLEDLTEKLAFINQNMLQLQKIGFDQKTIREIYRTLHNIKGTSATLGLPEFSVIAHKAEDFLSLLIDRTIELNDTTQTEFYTMLDALDQLKILHKNNSSKEQIQDFLNHKVKTLKKKEKVILLVENSKSIRKYIKKGLTQEGFTVIEAQDSLGALIRAITEHIDFLITSKEQAMIDGVNLINMVKANEFKSQVYTILITTEETANPNINKIIVKDKELLNNILATIRNTA